MKQNTAKQLVALALHDDETSQRCALLIAGHLPRVAAKRYPKEWSNSHIHIETWQGNKGINTFEVSDISALHHDKHQTFILRTTSSEARNNIPDTLGRIMHSTIIYTAALGIVNGYFSHLPNKTYSITEETKYTSGIHIKQLTSKFATPNNTWGDFTDALVAEVMERAENNPRPHEDDRAKAIGYTATKKLHRDLQNTAKNFDKGKMVADTVLLGMPQAMRENQITTRRMIERLQSEFHKRFPDRHLNADAVLNGLLTGIMKITKKVERSYK